MLPEVAEQSSRTERRAEEAERETEKIKKAEYMSYHLEEVFELSLIHISEPTRLGMISNAVISVKKK